MQIEGTENITYLLLSGIIVPLEIALDENITLMPADTSKLDFETAIATCSGTDDISVITAFIPRITAQFKIIAPTPKELAFLAWNSTWDALLLSSIFHTEVGFNIQSDTEASSISAQTKLRATNFHFHGFQASPYKLNADDVIWITENFLEARLLLVNEKFNTAVHCLASYRWHSMSRIQMAVLWAGIEGMFGASSEIRFRISLYIARFLHPNDTELRKERFELVKKLYNSRSSAVHGSKVKDNLEQSVNESAELLGELIRQCIVQKALPKEEELAP
ncbi:TPA: HEPN domain-containing protein [Yersinia enterocolitica]|uniref:HEPN domain-containing protein n=1 Tax=Yersinia enterocolitica TaxID=630 RepID=UPI0003626CCD|nr:HEPN domain-containing protein [Yersinia enterocolitica]